MKGAVLVLLRVSAVFLAIKVSFKVAREGIIALISLSVLEWYLSGIKTSSSHAQTTPRLVFFLRV